MLALRHSFGSKEKHKKTTGNNLQKLHSHSKGMSKATKVVFQENKETKTEENVKRKVAGLGKASLVRSQKCGGRNYRDFRVKTVIHAKSITEKETKSRDNERLQ